MRYTESRIYQRALELASLSKAMHDGLPVGFAFLSDQLKRASASVVLNFAEGSGKRTARDRRRYFDTAKGSAYEVAAVADFAQRFGVIDGKLHGQVQDACDHIAAMLTRYR